MTLNQIGIILNFIGGVLIYFNGLPSNVKTETLLKLNPGEKTQEDFNELVDNVLIELLSKLGMYLIGLGTLFQFWETM